MRYATEDAYRRQLPAYMRLKESAVSRWMKSPAQRVPERNRVQAIGKQSGRGVGPIGSASARYAREDAPGPAPLGPSAPRRERLAAFVEAYIHHILLNIVLIMLAESTTPGGRLGREVYPFWRHHVEILLPSIGVPHARFRADSIMSVLAADQLHRWKEAQEWAAKSLITAIQEAVDLLASPDR